MVRVAWEIPPTLNELIHDPALRVRDKVELAIAFYSRDHGGNAPSLAETARILGIAKQNVEKRLLELANQGRVERVDGKLVLKKTEQSHPLAWAEENGNAQNGAKEN